MNNRSFMKQYVITALVLFFFTILLFNLVRTYSKYLGVLSKVHSIQTLLTNVSSQNKKLEAEYKYYNSSYYKNKIASNDLNLVKGSNVYEYIVPKATHNSYINLPKNHNTPKNSYRKTSFIMWLKILF